jgi:CheY-like chemotaxis protein
MITRRHSSGSIFVVEDEPMIRMLLVEMLDELGYSVAAQTGDIDEALSFAQALEFDLAILDVNLNGKLISPVAELLEARQRRFVFATGYGSEVLPIRYRTRPYLQKPFQMEALASTLSAAIEAP